MHYNQPGVDMRTLMWSVYTSFGVVLFLTCYKFMSSEMLRAAYVHGDTHLLLNYLFAVCITERPALWYLEEVLYHLNM